MKNGASAAKNAAKYRPLFYHAPLYTLTLVTHYETIDLEEKTYDYHTLRTLAARLETAATRREQSPEEAARSILENAMWEEEAFAATGWLCPSTPPAWLDNIQPINPPTDGTNGLHRAFGALQTPETDEELAELLDMES